MKISRTKYKLFIGCALIVFTLSSINATVVEPVNTNVIQPNTSPALSVPSISGCEIFPENNYWNTPIDSLPVHALSTTWVNAIGANTSFHMDFAAYEWNGGDIGIPYNVVSGASVTNYTVSFQYAGESDPGPYPLPVNPLIEHGCDRHIVTIDTDDCTLYELYAASKSGSQWHAGSGAIWDLNSNDLRPDTWTSSDAAGLPILPGLARYEEVAAGVIAHALRFTSKCSANYYIWPARHKSQSGNCSTPPPFGARFRLRADYPMSGFSPEMQVIVQAMKTYGIVLADTGGSWVVNGVPNPGWDVDNNGYDDEIHELDVLKGTDFEAVDTSSLMIDPNSAGTPYHSYPFVSQITRNNPSPINFSTVSFGVTFNRVVTGVDTSDFILTTSGVSGATISGISGSGTSYTVTVNTGSGNGTIQLNLVDNNSILDSSSNPIGGLDINDGNFSGETYTIDKTPPTLSSITRGGSTPTASLSVSFLVTFSEPVTDVDISDFNLVTTGSLINASIIDLSGSGATRVVTVNTGNGDGTLGLNFIDNDTIKDLATNLITTTSLVGAVYTIDKAELPAPVLKSPATKMITNKTSLAFWWRTVTKAQTYGIQFASDSSFSTIVHSNNNVTAPYTPPAFTDGIYYWRVRAYSITNQPGAWSLTRTFTIDTTGPSAPTLTTPVASKTPTFRWSVPTGAVSYEIQVDTDSGFSNPIYYTTTLRGTSRKMAIMPSGIYYWRVRAKDSLGNWGAWSTTASITIP